MSTQYGNVKGKPLLKRSLIVRHKHHHGMCLIRSAFFNSFWARPLAIFLYLEGLIIPMLYLTLFLTSSLPGFASSYIACLVSGPPGPSKSRAFVGLEPGQLYPNGTLEPVIQLTGPIHPSHRASKSNLLPHPREFLDCRQRLMPRSQPLWCCLGISP